MALHLHLAFIASLTFHVRPADTLLLTLSYSIVEEQPAGVVVGNVLHDLDLRTTLGDVALSSLRFALTTNGKAPGLFSIDEVTGQLRSTAVIDREAVCPAAEGDCVVRLSVQIKPARYFAVVKVDVRVRDVNDHAPTFACADVTLALSEAALPGVRVALPAAVDGDSAQFAVHNYTLTPPSDHFAVSYDPLGSDLQLVLRTRYV